MRIIKIGHYTIGILEADCNDFEFTIDIDNIHITSGVGETFEKPKKMHLKLWKKNLSL